jgi:ferric-dicitrate binding protein FerR (iron transport regulator)
MPMIESHEKLILKYFQGDLSPEERKKFESWVNQSDDNRKMVSDFQNVWELSAHREENMDFESGQEWATLRNSLSQKRDARVVAGLHPGSFAYKIAAAVAFLVVSTFVFYMVAVRNHQIVHETADQTLHVVLPDSSEVWLNEGSRLLYPDDFTSERSLILEGEGFFQVKPDLEKPFVIRADEVQIQVLGTSFNVKAYAEEGQTQVFVVTGKVSLSSTEVNKSIILIPGSIGMFNKESGLTSSEIEEDLNIVAWKDRRLVFRKTPLGEVIKTVEKYFKTDIRIKNEELAGCRFTSEFNNPTLQEVIETLSVALDLKVEFQSDTYSLDGEGCNTN